MVTNVRKQSQSVANGSKQSKATFPLTRLSVRRVAFRRPRCGNKNRSDTFKMLPFHTRDWPRGQFAALPVIAHVAISAFIHRAFISPYHMQFYIFPGEFFVMSGSSTNWMSNYPGCMANLVRVLVTSIRHPDFTYNCIFVRLWYIFVYIKIDK